MCVIEIRGGSISQLIEKPNRISGMCVAHRSAPAAQDRRSEMSRQSAMNLVQPFGQLVVALFKAERHSSSAMSSQRRMKAYTALSALRLRRGKHQKSVVEILGRRPGNAAGKRNTPYPVAKRSARTAWAHFPPAVLIASFPSAARATRANLRRFRNCGTLAQHGIILTFDGIQNFLAAAAKEFDIESPRPRSTLAISGNPCANHSRARSTSNFIISRNAAVFSLSRIAVLVTPNRRRSSSGR